MLAGLRPRGPDGGGIYAGPGAVLGTRRLSIIDLVGADQPLFNGDRSLVLVANAEIYNYVELRSDLRARGHSFSTAGDCEVILHLYEELGAGSVLQLRGMFAFALFDTRRGTVLLARACSWLATASARNRCTTTTRPAAWCSPRMSRGS